MTGLPGSERLSSQRGTTLIELLVVLAAGMVVVSALFGILDVTANQTSRTVSRVTATQQGRVAIARMQQLLNTSCVGSGTPIRSDSTADKLVFLAAYGSDPQPVPELHVITFTPGGATHGTLVDQTFTNPSGQDYSNPATTWTLASTRTLLGDVDSQPSEPIFQYFGYENPLDHGSPARPYLDQNGNEYLMLLDGSESMPDDAKHADGTSAAGETPSNDVTPLTGTDVTRAGEVKIRLIAYPSEGRDVNPAAEGAGATISNTVSLRLTPPQNHAGSDTEAPCG